MGVPSFDASGVPQQAECQQSVPQPPQYAPQQQPQYGQQPYGGPHQTAPAPFPQAQFPQTPVSQPQFPQRQFPQPPFPQPPFPQPAFPQPPQFPSTPYQQGPFEPGRFGPIPYGPPKKSRKPLIIGLLSLFAIAAVAATVLVIAPWKSTPEEKTATFALSDGVSAQVRLPIGWDAQSDTEDGKTLIRIHEDTDDRILTQLSDNLRSLSKTGSGTAMHTIVMFSDTCSSSMSGQDWTTKNRDDSSTKHTERWLYASSKVDQRRCLNLSAVDSAADSVTAGTTARKTLQKLIDEDRVTASKSV